ncbi:MULTISPECIES: adenylyl-sulfate kinase [Pseudomonas]|uniref:Adenylyl-sulfate kinase n=1 Tax=Pseudomonas luteola TaxID=47886 RepID=A0A2X2D2J6_PSELU|nr:MULTISPECIES: adenylyl-sulfate kinase [Pseudomonas]ENA32722.1 adenylylsulfate kinase [Pseudomonas sp. HPB0071]MBF8642141.1 adenylyl-sulfate kinase [Pseudomonas zeshuii]RRW43448.1 adenylyl-sulfate kinase [Pseudomonas luteola]SHJ08291.1 adenylylsulfate kinase [Pseudomonas zeshuii]SPZ13183.1 bifunctional enzyme NodQ [Pseudomonas luteola]
MGSCIRPYDLTLPASARAQALGQKPCCLWLTGLSGAGKSTLANSLDLALHQRGLHAYVLDGDNLRNGLCRDLGMSAAERSENSRRIAEVAKLMVEAGLVVIVSAISPFQADRDAARALFEPGQFRCVYVSTSFEECARRDPKGLYRAAREGRIHNFTGFDSPYEPPYDADCEIDTARLSIPEATQALIELLTPEA